MTIFVFFIPILWNSVHTDQTDKNSIALGNYLWGPFY